MESTAHAQAPSITERKSRIAFLNDQLRKTGLGGKFVITGGVASLGDEKLAGVVNAMREYDTWSEDNDPHGEHDFGMLTLANSQKVFFKIDYYDTRMEFGSDDPADPEKTTRVLTLMLAEEY
ncbi:MAG: DUF3768 domain-containing protein [Candidatus Moranbacteria bacterium]|nr:DUF3768 domain-containing protein [Candidatus Moranbacteria bacterium]